MNNQTRITVLGAQEEGKGIKDAIKGILGGEEEGETSQAPETSKPSKPEDNPEAKPEKEPEPSENPQSEEKNPFVGKKPEEEQEKEEDEDEEEEEETEVSLRGWKEENGSLSPGTIACIGLGVALVICAFAFLIKKKWKEARTDFQNTEKPEKPFMDQKAVGGKVASGTAAVTAAVGKVHHIGKRQQQQDSFGVTNTANGLFAVVADGMGGLANGDKVSQKVVMTMLQDAVQRKERTNDRMLRMVSHVNGEVNRMLGTSGQYKSGSTLIAVFAEQGMFEWISVGDSRIYLYRGGKLLQLNREHTYEGELLQKAVNGEVSFMEAKQNPQRKGLTSFIGMGRLKYVDGSHRPAELLAGDVLLLMSDGIFNTLSEKELCQIIGQSGGPEQMAAVMESRILTYDRPKQDNFTAIILQF